MANDLPGGVPPQSEILTIDEVAEYLRLTPQTIYKWAQERQIPATKLGKEWRFRRSLIDRWLDEKMLGPQPERPGPGSSRSEG